MKKLIPLIAIVLAMALPLTITAQTYYDYTVETPTIEWVETAINAGDITFGMPAHKTAFLAGIQQLYDYRDAENWSACVTTAGLLEAATTYINGDVKGQVAELCDATEEIYGYDEESFLEVEISPTDEDAMKDNLCDAYFQILWIEFWIEHIQACDPWRGQHQEEACHHRWHFTFE